MFRENENLIEVDLNNFNMSNVTSMWTMFRECKNLISVNMTKVDTSKVTYMNGLFHYCTSLTSINLSNFDTSQVTQIDSIFDGCTNLEYINIQNFKDINYIKFEKFFDGVPDNVVICVNKENINSILDQLENIACYNISCSDVWRPHQKKLIYKNNKCVDDCSNTEYKYEFYGKCYEKCDNNIKDNDINICHYYFDYNDNTYKECYNTCKTCKISSNETDHNCDECIDGYKFLNDSSLKSKNCYKQFDNYYYIDKTNDEYNCIDSCSGNYKKVIIQKNKCIDECNKDDTYIYDNNGNCFETCPPNKKVDEEEKKCYDSCPEYKFEYNNYCLTDCPNNTYRFFTNRYICLETLNESYYFDEKDNIYKICYENCKRCNGEGNDINNNCIECKDGFILLKEPTKFNNCFNCKYYYYIEESDNYYCTKDNNCIPNYKKYIPDKKKCINLCINDNIYKLEYNGNCVQYCPNGTYISNNICHNNNASITEILEKESQDFVETILNGNVDFNNLTDNNTIVTKNLINGVIMSAGTTDIFKNNFNSEITSVDLGSCEEEIKVYYNISLNQSLIIVKGDFKSNYSLIPKVGGFQIIDPNTLKLLNLSHCKTNEAKLYYPVVIDVSNLFLFDPNSDFYNDNCFVYTTENGTDIILKDRQQEFINKNLSLCDNKCIFLDYDSINKQSICACEIQNKAETISDLINNPNQIPKEFIINEESKKSANMMPIKCLSLSGLKNNIASYLLLFICLYFLLSLLYFMKCGFYILKSEVDKILHKKEKDIIKKKDNQITQGNSIRERGKNNYPPKRGGIRFINNEIQNKRYHRVLRSDINSITKSYNKFNVFKTDKEKEINDNKQNKIKTAKKKGKKGNINYKFNFNDYELNTMSYSEAIIFDKRTCFEYYISLIKTKHPVYFGFCCINDYNLFIIKSSMFFLSFAVCFAVNYFFFNEDIIHKIYEQGGKYDILFFIPTICISFSVYHILTIIIKLVFLSERNLLEIKMQKTHREANAKSYDVLCCLRIKHIFYFSLGIIFISIFWLFLSSFSAVYQNTQIILAKNTIISFSISFIYPFIMNIIPCLFRICSLSGNNQYLYNVSKFFQLI